MKCQKLKILRISSSWILTAGVIWKDTILKTIRHLTNIILAWAHESQWLLLFLSQTALDKSLEISTYTTISNKAGHWYQTLAVGGNVIGLSKCLDAYLCNPWLHGKNNGAPLWASQPLNGNFFSLTTESFWWITKC